MLARSQLAMGCTPRLIDRLENVYRSSRVRCAPYDVSIEGPGTLHASQRAKLPWPCISPPLCARVCTNKELAVRLLGASQVFLQAAWAGANNSGTDGGSIHKPRLPYAIIITSHDQSRPRHRVQRSECFGSSCSRQVNRRATYFNSAAWRREH